jgi:hypothetical protein
LPAGVLAASGAVVLVLVLVAAWRPASMWPLHGAALAVVLGASAWCADELLAPLVEVSPRARPFAARVRSLGPALLAVLWVAVHVARRDELPPHLAVLVGQGVTAALVGSAIGVAARARGDASGGSRAALVVVPVLVAWALARPWSGSLPVFPLWPWDPWGRSAVLWSLAAVAAVASLAHAAAVGR